MQSNIFCKGGIKYRNLTYFGLFGPPRIRNPMHNRRFLNQIPRLPRLVFLQSFPAEPRAGAGELRLMTGEDQPDPPCWEIQRPGGMQKIEPPIV